MIPATLLQYWPVAAFVLGGFGALLKWQQAMYERQLDQLAAFNTRMEADRNQWRTYFFQALQSGNKAASEAEKALAEKALTQSAESSKP